MAPRVCSINSNYFSELERLVNLSGLSVHKALTLRHNQAQVDDNPCYRGA